MNLRWGAAAILVCLPGFGQSPGEKTRKLVFEVASIRPSPEMPQGHGGIGMHIDGAQVSCSFLTLKDYVSMAYRVKLNQISAPDWVGSTRFNISAKLPEGGTREQAPEMLQSLLAERFGLKFHHESKEFPVYALTTGNRSKLKESSADAGEEPKSINVVAEGSRNGTSLNLGNGSYFTFSDNRFEARKLAIPSMVDLLGRFLDRPVIDMTGLNGKYDFTFDVTPEDYHAMLVRSAIAAGVNLPPEAMRGLDASGDSLFSGLESAGLKLERRKAPLDVLVVDHIEKTPTEN